MHITQERDVIFRRWRDLAELDWYVLLPVLVLIFISFILLTSAFDGHFLSKQLFFLIPACLIALLALFFRISFWREYAIYIYLLNFLLLVIVSFLGTKVMGAQRWIDLGPINIQPSEIAKIGLIISLAAWYTKYPIKSYKDIFVSFIIVLPMLVLVIKQPDLGTSLSFIVIYIGMSFWAGATFTHLLVVLSPIISLVTSAAGVVLFSIGSIQFKGQIIELGVTNCFMVFLVFLLVWLIAHYKPFRSPMMVFFISVIFFFNSVFGFIRPVLWSLLKPYQQQRLIVFLNPEGDPLGAGYHIVQSLLAIGNGGLFGYGWLKGRLTKGEYVPAQHTDFIFSIVGEEFGFVGCIFILTLFFILLWRGLYIALYSENKFASLLAIGIFSFFTFHIFINIGMTIGLMPITGVPLPFLSYGGSALVVDLFSVCLLLSISWRFLPRKMF